MGKKKNLKKIKIIEPLPFLTIPHSSHVAKLDPSFETVRRMWCKDSLLEAQARLCLPSASQKGSSAVETHLRRSESLVPTLCITDGTDDTSETTTIPLAKISLPCGVSKPIC